MTRAKKHAYFLTREVVRWRLERRISVAITYGTAQIIADQLSVMVLEQTIINEPVAELTRINNER